MKQCRMMTEVSFKSSHFADLNLLLISAPPAPITRKATAKYKTFISCVLKAEQVDFGASKLF